MKRNMSGALPSDRTVQTLVVDHSAQEAQLFGPLLGYRRRCSMDDWAVAGLVLKAALERRQVELGRYDVDEA